MKILSNNKFIFFFTILIVIACFSASVYLFEIEEVEVAVNDTPVIPIKVYDAMEKFESHCCCGFFHTDHHYFALDSYSKLYDFPSLTDEDGTTMVSLEYLGLALDMNYAKTDTDVTLSKNDSTAVFEIESSWVTKDGHYYSLNESSIIQYNQVFVPLRQTVEEVFGYPLYFDEGSSSYLIYNLEDQIPEEEFETKYSSLNQSTYSYIDEDLKAQCFEGEEFTITFYFDSKTYGNRTACGNEAQYGTIAADSMYPFGTKFYIPFLDFIATDCIFTVEDRGGLVTGNHLDVYLPNQDYEDPVTKEAFTYGRFTTTCYRFKEFERIKRH